ncbi:MAG: tRNA lysidine(34) synthetase TilS [Cyanobacteria bacterium J083]|nr:MAG: tRNA lysidine(34) synthetase TilS [Cyanobacteria bacterium J083]
MSDWSIFHARVHLTLKQRALLPHHSKILIAVSGGQDSVCLAKILRDLQAKWHWQLAIAHCDHGWSSDAGISKHVADFAQSLALPFYLTATTGLPETEAAARKWRYQALTELAQRENFPYIVTGHTKSDRAETLLYNLVRGSGTDGLQALSWRRNLTPSIQLIRPLLNFSRAETLEFCQQFRLPVWFDVVNENLEYARNRIRQELIPYLQTHFNQQVETALAQTAELLGADVEYLENIAENILQKLLVKDQQAIERKLLENQHLAIQRRVIRRFLTLFLPKKPTFKEIEAVTTLISAPKRSRSSSLPGNKVALVENNLIKIISLSEQEI